MNVLAGKTVKIKTKNYTIALDGDCKDTDYSFLSHAHADHLFKTSKKVVCSDPTCIISHLRGKSIVQEKSLNNIELLNSAHILGSKSLLIKEGDERLLFTGDFSTNTRGFMKGFKPVRCDTLIIESTFGSPFFIFPDYEEEMKKAKDWVDDNIRKGYLSVLMGYSLGKSQELQYYFKNYNKSVNENISLYNKIYEDYGISLGSNSLPQNSDLLFTTPMRTNNNYFNSLRRKKGLRFAVFSGWNMIPSYRKRFNADAGFTVSDHADFKGLLEVVKKSKAKTVYVNHGNSETFTNFLRTEGICAINL
ncbi:MAG: hypothetical protein JW791_01990 [Nanoarchaeota archaeon]|nr:hypothetical protein [Nanoarchaeota archaeon]